jgi:hypothetical protein
VQGLAQAIGGTVTHVQLLVDGKAILDQTPSGQSSVTVSATFDSLVFAEGCLLSVQMQVWDNTLAAPAHLSPIKFSYRVLRAVRVQ